MSGRTEQYKNKGKDAVASRHERAQTSVELRKNKKEEIVNKRRQMNDIEDGDDIDEAGDRPELSTIVQNANSNDPEIQLNAVQSARSVDIESIDSTPSSRDRRSKSRPKSRTNLGYLTTKNNGRLMRPESCAVF